MGQLYQHPLIEKDTGEGESDYLLYGLSSMQGYRITMEDRHAAILDQPVTDGYPPTSFFGVFDGHSGDLAANELSGSLWLHVQRNEARRVREAISRGERPVLFEDDTSLEDSFLAADHEYRMKLESDVGSSDSSGSTCISCIVVPYENEGSRSVEITCCNVGDSRCVLFDNGIVTPLSHDHKPNDPVENSRIVSAGGFVDYGRVNGSLALSRAFGDFVYKQHPDLPARDQVVTTCPTMQRARVSLTPAPPDAPSRHTFLLLACDGIWDVMTNEVAARFVEERLVQQETGQYGRLRRTHKTKFYTNPDFKIDAKYLPIFVPQLNPGEYDLGAICEDLIDECVLGLDSKDNVSASIVLFLKQSTE